MARLRRMPARRVATLLAFSVVTLLAATPSASAAPAALPKPDHVLIVFMENKDTDEILGSKDAPYLNALAASGASFTNAHAETHPSQPNYLAMFSGGTQGVTDDWLRPQLRGGQPRFGADRSGAHVRRVLRGAARGGLTGCAPQAAMRASTAHG